MSLFDRVFLRESDECSALPTYAARSLVILDSIWFGGTVLSEASGDRHLSSELRIAQEFERGKDRRLAHLGRQHAQGILDHQAKSSPKPPSIHPELAQAFADARKAAREKEAAKRAAKKARMAADAERRAREAREQAAMRVPDWSQDNQNAADGMVDHAANYYQHHQAMRDARHHLRAIEKVNPDHPEIEQRRQAVAGHAANAKAAADAIRQGMSQNQFHASHIQHVLQPSLHDIDPGSRRHFDAVAHFMGGESRPDGSYEFPADGDGHMHFHSWAALHHGDKLPIRKDNTVTFRRGAPKRVGPSSAELQKQYAPQRAPEKEKRDLEDVARGHATDHANKIAGGALDHLIKTKKIKPLGDGLYEIRIFSGPNHGAMRVYTDIQGNYLDYSDKDDQDRVIADRARSRLKQSQQSRQEGAELRTLAMLEWVFGLR